MKKCDWLPALAHDGAPTGEGDGVADAAVVVMAVAMVDRSASEKTVAAAGPDNDDNAEDASWMVGGDAPTKSTIADTWDFTIPGHASLDPMVLTAAFKKATTASTL